MVAHRGKTVDKGETARKVLVLLKKAYPGAAPKPDLPVLETLLYAVCLEDAAPAQAEHAYARILNSFQDLNEVRVSSIFELQSLFDGVDHTEWRALRLKNILQHVFETTYSFDFDGLKRKTADLAAKQLGKVPALSPFVRNFALQNALGSHVLPIDARQHAALVWLGLAEPESEPEAAGDSLRSHVRKADAQLFCHVLRMFATDPQYSAILAPANTESTLPGITRLELLLKQGPAALAKAVKKATPPPPPAPRAEAPAKSRAAAPAKSAKTKSSSTAEKTKPKKAATKVTTRPSAKRSK